MHCAGGAFAQSVTQADVGRFIRDQNGEPIGSLKAIRDNQAVVWYWFAFTPGNNGFRQGPPLPRRAAWVERGRLRDHADPGARPTVCCTVGCETRPSRTGGRTKTARELGTSYSVVATIRAEAIRVRITAAPTGAKGSASCHPPGSGRSLGAISTLQRARIGR